MKTLNFYLLSVSLCISMLFLLTKPAFSQEIIVDDGDRGFIAGQGWEVDRYIKGYAGSNCLRNGNWDRSSSSCKYHPNFPHSGEYGIYVWWPNGLGVTKQVPYVIHYSGGSETVRIDQGRGYKPRMWKLIGKWKFEEGASGYVEVWDKSTSRQVYVYADAIKFVYVGVPNEPPTANPSADKTSGYAPLTVQFYGDGDDPDGFITEYRWNFGDNSRELRLQNPTHTYENAGTYTATLTVTDNKGTKGSDDIPIRVRNPFISESQIPHLLRFQGRIADKGDNPLDGLYSITFRIYDAETGGNLLWEETQTKVLINKGIFSVLLGSKAPLELKFDKDYWLSTEIGGNDEMTPRQRITSVGYAYRAEAVNKAGICYSGHVDIGRDSPETIYLHLDGAPRSIKLYLWGEKSDQDTYPDDVKIEIDAIDKTQILLDLANQNWDANETSFGDGSAGHALVIGANNVTGTGQIDISSIIDWAPGEHMISFTQSEYGSGRIKYNIYIKY